MDKNGRGRRRRYGHAVGMAGDVNGDGYADLVVAAPWYGMDDAGRVYVYHGSAGGLGISADWTSSGGSANEKMGPRGHDGRCRRRRLRRYRCRRLRLQQYGRQSRYLPWFGFRPARQPHLDRLRRIRRRPVRLHGRRGRRRERRRLHRFHRRRLGIQYSWGRRRGQGVRLPRLGAIVADSASWNASGQAAGDELRRRGRRGTSTATATPTSSSAHGATDGYRGKAYVYYGSARMSGSAAWTAKGEYATIILATPWARPAMSTAMATPTSSLVPRVTTTSGQSLRLPRLLAGRAGAPPSPK